MTNVGKSPATQVEMFAMLCPDIIVARDAGDATADILHTAIFNFGVVLFPAGTNSKNLTIGMPIAKFRERIRESVEIVTEHTNPAEARDVARPAIMACASYRRAGSPKRHHTVILFEVRHTYEGHLGWDGSADETNVVFLKLVQTFMSGQVT
jgi:hypothetical protein